MTDNLRDRIAAAIYNACDDYTRKLMVRPDCPGASELEGDGKPVCYVLADAVIRELGLRTEWLTDAGSRLGIPHLTKPDNPIATRTASPWTAHTHQDTP